MSPPEEAALVAGLGEIAVTPFRFQGWTAHRLTASFGWAYDFDMARFSPADPIPALLEPLRRRAAAFAGIPVDRVVHAMVTRYGPGAGIGWHRDRPVFDTVIGVSLGTAATLRFRRRIGDGGFERAAQPLLPRSIYRLTGPSRTDWEHSITPLSAPRWSVTFRTLAERGDSPARRRAQAG